MIKIPKENNIMKTFFFRIEREKRGGGDRDQLVVLSDTSDYFKL